MSFIKFMENTTPQKFFLYARKSTDVEDKQILSIEAQITELRAFAKQNNLDVIEEFVEKQSAKIPGRSIFNSMLSRIEKGEVSGILAWHPDRLARNSVDGGRVIYLLDCGRIVVLKFPTFWFEPTPQGKFMLNIAFGQSKYYIDSLSENVRRGLRQKVRRGEYPGPAPIGYLNDPRTKTVVVDQKKAKIIRAAIELYAQGDQRLEDIAHFLAQDGIVRKSGKVWHRDTVRFLLSNPFYYGHFRYAGEIHEGKHESIITKKLFDTAQEVLRQRGKPQRKPKNEPQAFCGLLSCAECGMMITAEKQKGHVYYRCTKKGKQKCSQPYLREEALNKQLSSLIQKVSLSQDWAEKLLEMVNADQEKSAQSTSVFVQEARGKIKTISLKLQRLLDGYLEQDIEREVYRAEKAKLMSEKKSLEEQIYRLEQKQNDWLEPFKEWLNYAQTLAKIARDSDLFEKKAAAKEIFGSNLLLSGRRARFGGPQQAQNQWAALRAAHEKARNFPASQILVGAPGLEPGTSSLSVTCSSQLSYAPKLTNKMADCHRLSIKQ